MRDIDDDDMDLELSHDNYAEDYFNDEAGGDETNISDLDEIEDEDTDLDEIEDEIPVNGKGKKKKKKNSRQENLSVSQEDIAQPLDDVTATQETVSQTLDDATTTQQDVTSQTLDDVTATQETASQTLDDVATQQDVTSQTLDDVTVPQEDITQPQEEVSQPSNDMTATPVADTSNNMMDVIDMVVEHDDYSSYLRPSELYDADAPVAIDAGQTTQPDTSTPVTPVWQDLSQDLPEQTPQDLHEGVSASLDVNDQPTVKPHTQTAEQDLPPQPPSQQHTTQQQSSYNAEQQAHSDNNTQHVDAAHVVMPDTPDSNSSVVHNEPVSTPTTPPLTASDNMSLSSGNTTQPDTPPSQPIPTVACDNNITSNSDVNTTDHGTVSGSEYNSEPVPTTTSSQTQQVQDTPQPQSQADTNVQAVTPQQPDVTEQAITEQIHADVTEQAITTGQPLVDVTEQLSSTQTTINDVNEQPVTSPQYANVDKQVTPTEQPLNDVNNHTVTPQPQAVTSEQVAPTGQPLDNADTSQSVTPDKQQASDNNTSSSDDKTMTLSDKQIIPITQAYISSQAQYAHEFQTEAQAGLTSVNTAHSTSSHADTDTDTHKHDTDTHNNSVTEEKQTSTADNSDEQVETEKKKADFKAQSLHKFSDTMNFIAQRSHAIGSTAVSYVVSQVVKADENSAEGYKKLKQFTGTFTEAATYIGMAALAGSYTDNIRQIAKAGKAADTLLSQGRITADTLLMSKHDLDKHLKASGLSGSKRAAIVKHRTEIHDMMGVRSEMQSMIATGQIKADKHMSDTVSSSSFFNLHDKHSIGVLQAYYNNSSDDLLRNKLSKNFAGRSAGSYSKLLRRLDKYNASPNSKAAVKMGKLASGNIRARRQLEAFKAVKVRVAFRKMFSNVISADENSREGVKTLATAKKLATPFAMGLSKILIGTGKHGYKGLLPQTMRHVVRFGRFTDKTMYKLTNHSLGHLVNSSVSRVNALRTSIRQGGELAKKAALNKMKQTRDKALNKAAGTAVGKKVVKVNNARMNMTNAAISKYKSAQRAARKTAQKLSQTRAAKAAVATGHALAKTADIFIGTPMRFGAGIFRKVKLTIGKVFNAVNTIKKTLITAVGLFCVVYVLLVTMVSAILSVTNTNSIAITSILLPDRDEFVKESIERYLKKSNDIKDEAVKLGKGTPLTTQVTNSHTISRYGHPDSNGNWVNGYKIYYTDSNGNILQDGANNVKDTLILAYVQMYAEWGRDAENNATELMDKYFNWLNPSTNHNTLVSNSKESDIYSCPGGCTTVYYKCNDYTTLTNSNLNCISQSQILSQKANGAHFYGSIVSKSSGDYYVGYCRGHRVDIDDKHYTYTYHSSRVNGRPSRCNNYYYRYYCTGHSIKACYGHRDISIYIPVKKMIDAFNERYMVSDHSFPTKLNGGNWTQDDKDWCNSLYDTDWYDLYGKDPTGGNGFSVN